jgi:hypothetical protein
MPCHSLDHVSVVKPEWQNLGNLDNGSLAHGKPIAVLRIRCGKPARWRDPLPRGDTGMDVPFRRYLGDELPNFAPKLTSRMCFHFPKEGGERLTAAADR